MDTVFTKKQLELFRQGLCAMKLELETATQLTKQDRAPVELDQQSVGRLSRMDALQVQAMSQAQQRQRETDLRRIVGALGRLSDSEFGYCLECGEPIAIKRLEIDPAAASCIHCASK